MDHNELGQAVAGADEADIIAVLDHHRLGNAPTALPIPFVVEPVGSTCTLVTEHCQQHGFQPPAGLAGMMLSGILSDTLVFRSPTTTDRDIEAAAWLADLSRTNVETYGNELLRAAPGLTTRAVEEIVDADRKKYEMGGKQVSIAQVEVTGFQELPSRRDEILVALQSQAQREGLALACVMITDIVEGVSHSAVPGRELDIGLTARLRVRVKTSSIWKTSSHAKSSSYPPCTPCWKKAAETPGGRYLYGHAAGDKSVYGRGSGAGTARHGAGHCGAVAEGAGGARTMRAMPLHRRAAILAATARRLVAETEPLARLITSESGKTIRETRAEVARAAGIFQLAAEETRRLHGETLPFDAFAGGEGRTGYWTREPVGVVGAITPWNVPLALSAHKIAPALGAGNAVVHKPAEQTPLCALRLAEILYEAGLPENALRVVTGLGEEAGDALVTHPDVAFVSFTGSREVGMRLPGRAGFKKVALELGGNSPVIVTPSADLDAAAEAIVRGGFAVAGQLCISVQRVIVQATVRERLADLILPRVQALRVGDPMDESTDVGTLIDGRACDRVMQALEEARQAGATVRGRRRTAWEQTRSRPPCWKTSRRDAPLALEEAFAPLIVLMPYTTLDDAIALANATPYGLNAGIYTNDLREAMTAAREIVAGAVMINDVPTFRSDLMPYGGRKQSGLGREGVRFAMEEMTELKVVCFRA